MCSLQFEDDDEDEDEEDEEEEEVKDREDEDSPQSEKAQISVSKFSLAEYVDEPSSDEEDDDEEDIGCQSKFADEHGDEEKDLEEDDYGCQKVNNETGVSVFSLAELIDSDTSTEELTSDDGEVEENSENEDGDVALRFQALV